MQEFHKYTLDKSKTVPRKMKLNIVTIVLLEVINKKFIWLSNERWLYQRLMKKDVILVNLVVHHGAITHRFVKYLYSKE